MSAYKAIRVDMSGFESFDRLTGAEQTEFLAEVSKELAARFLSSVKKKTRVGRVPKYMKKIIGKKRWEEIYEEHWKGYVGGQLRNAWTVENRFRTVAGGSRFIIDVVNPMEYASYVNDGYFRRSRYTEALGIRLRAKKIEGQNFVERAENELNAEKLVEARLRQRLRRIFGNG